MPPAIKLCVEKDESDEKSIDHFNKPTQGRNSDILAGEFVRGATDAGNSAEKICLYGIADKLKKTHLSLSARLAFGNPAQHFIAGNEMLWGAHLTLYFPRCFALGKYKVDSL